MTDRSIARLGLRAIGLDATEDDIDALLEAYLTELRAELLVADAAQYRVHAGVTEALRLSGARGMALGLGTGNVAEGARLKLEHVGLYHHFAFGGFGDDHELRVELIRRGAERGAASLGHSLSACRVVIIGDTPKDIDAARGIGAESIGVGTGSFSAAELRAHGASHAFDDLTDPDALTALLGD